MMIQLLLLMLVPEPQQNVDQQRQLDQMRQELQLQRQRIEELTGLVRQNQTGAQNAVCTAELRLANGAPERTAPPGTEAVVPLNLFSVVSQPSKDCLQADVLITATYIDANNRLVCSGTVENVAAQNRPIQSINLDLRPRDFRDFVRWRNEPLQNRSGPRRLECINVEGLAEATSEELERVSAVKVRATVLPQGGGMSTTEIQISLR